MIASVRGTVLAIDSHSAVIEVGGVGLHVQCTPTALAPLRLGEVAVLPTSLVVREESLTLFGFADTDERTIFEKVQTVSGIGPRIAQAMLAALRPHDIRKAVTSGDVRTLTAVPGIGTKGAQRLVLELRDRLGPAPADYADASDGDSLTGQVRAALLALGWGAREADEAVERVSADVESELIPAEVPAMLRAALRRLDRG